MTHVGHMIQKPRTIFNSSYSFHNQPNPFWKWSDSNESLHDNPHGLLLRELGWYYIPNKPNISFYYYQNKLITDNMFLSPQDKKNISLRILKVLRIIYIAKKYARLWKIKSQSKKYIQVNSTDLLLQPVNNKNSITVYEMYEMYETNKTNKTNKKNKTNETNKTVNAPIQSHTYSFTTHDIYALVQTSLVSNNMWDFKLSPLRNPYTQNIFKKQELYNIYIKIRHLGKRESNVHIPWLFREYALVDFDQNAFSLKHYSFLKHMALQKYFKDMKNEQFIQECEKILQKFVCSLYELPGTFKYNFEYFDIHYIRTEFMPLLVKNAHLVQIYMKMIDRNLFIKLEKEVRNGLHRFWSNNPECVVSKPYENKFSRLSHGYSQYRTTMPTYYSTNTDEYDYSSDSI